LKDVSKILVLLFQRDTLVQSVNLWATVFLFFEKRTAAYMEGDALKPHVMHHADILFKVVWQR